MSLKPVIQFGCYVMHGFISSASTVLSVLLLRWKEYHLLV